MKTLNKTITAGFYKTESGFSDLVTLWGGLTNSESRVNLDSSKQLLYLILKGKDWRRGFSPVTSQKKLDNGAYKFSGIMCAMSGLRGLDNTPRKVRVNGSYVLEDQEAANLRANTYLQSRFPEFAPLLSETFITQFNILIGLSGLSSTSDFEFAYENERAYMELN